MRIPSIDSRDRNWDFPIGNSLQERIWWWFLKIKLLQPAFCRQQPDRFQNQCTQNSASGLRSELPDPIPAGEPRRANRNILNPQTRYRDVDTNIGVALSPTFPTCCYSASVGAAVAATFDCSRFSRFLRSASAKSAMTASIWTSLSKLLR